MITKNEEHNIRSLFDNLNGFASQVIALDSYSTDNTAKLLLQHGAEVFYRSFDNFGSQWNHAISLPAIREPWVMKLDPDERLSPQLKNSIFSAITSGQPYSYQFARRLWFMGRPLPATQKVVRLWRSGTCSFSDRIVNEYPINKDPLRFIPGLLEHLDSPNLTHWFAKQNLYTDSEAIISVSSAASPDHTASHLRRFLLRRLPFVHVFVFFYCYFFQRAFLAGVEGYTWAYLRAFVYRMRRIKAYEYRNIGCP